MASTTQNHSCSKPTGRRAAGAPALPVATVVVFAIGLWTHGPQVAVSLAQPSRPIDAAPNQTSSAAATASADFVLLDRQLRPTPAMVSGIDIRPDGRGEVRTLDASGREQRASIQDFTALAPEGFAASPDQARSPATAARQANVPGWIELTDGQFLTGLLLRADQSGEDLVWFSPHLGQFLLSIDRVRRIVLSVEASERHPEGADTVADSVLLTNGDVLRGFIEGIETDDNGRTRISIETDGRSTRLPYDALARVTLRSSPAPRAAIGPNRPVARVQFRDGSAVLVSQLSTVSDSAPTSSEPAASALRGGQGETRPDHQHDNLSTSPIVSLSVPSLRAASIADPAAEPSSINVGLSEVRSIVPLATRVVPLSDLAVVRHEPASERRRAARPDVPRLLPVQLAERLGAAPIALDGPCVVEWELPADLLTNRAGEGSPSAHLAGRISLRPGAAPWGDCDYRLELVDPAAEADAEATELAAGRLSTSNPSAMVSASVPVASGSGPQGRLGGPSSSAAAFRLRLTVLPGAFGPVRDAVELSDFLVSAAGG